MKRPFVYLSSSLLLGIIFSYYIDMNTLLCLILFFMVLLINIIKIIKYKIRSLDLLLSLFILGIILNNFKTTSSQLLEYKDNLVEVTAVVDEILSIEEDESKYVVKAININHNGANRKVSEKIQLKILGRASLSIGDEFLFRGILREPLPNTNPKLYNHKLNLLTEGIFVTTTIRDSSIQYIIEGDCSNITIIKYKFIERVERTFDSYLTERNSSLMKAVILGKNAYLDEENIGKFRQLGLAHILAVSGLHIGLIVSILTGLLAYIGINKNINIIITLGAIWLYAYIIGYPPSVIRANIMFSLLLISKTWGEAYDSINTLFFAIFIMLILNPYWAFSIGFQLSFIATFFLVFLTPRLKENFNLGNSQWLKSLIAIISVQIGLLPIQAYYFNRFSILGIMANLFIVPLFSLCLILGLFLLCFSNLLVPIAYSIGLVIDFLLDIQFFAIDILSYFPYIELKILSPSIVGVLCYYILLFISIGIIEISNIDKKINKTIIFYLLFLIFINSLSIYIDQSIDIRFIDVGQGDSILIRTQGGDYLIDTGGNPFGNFSIGESILLPYLEKEGIFKLDGIFITHYDEDHCKSLPYLMDNIKIEKIYIGYKRIGNKLYEDIINKAAEKGIPVILLKKGKTLVLDDNTTIVVTGPPEDLVLNSSIDENDLSLVLLMNYYNKNVLFTGDIEELGESHLVEVLDTKVDFLKVPHHGSKTSSSEELLDKLDPSIAFISVGRNNVFGHPHEEVVNRYRERDVQLYRTDELGLINLKLNQGKYEINPFLKEKRNILYVVKYFYLHLCFIIFYIIISYFLIKYYKILEKEMKTIEL